jgi:glycosyltransferase involved in cell wall biosynthesis
MDKTLLYFREISCGLDSGMTLQVINDYGHLSNLGYTVVVPVYCNSAANQQVLERFVETNGFKDLKLFFCRSKYKKLRFMSVFTRFWNLLHSKKTGCVLVLRERKNLLPAKVLSFISGVPVVSELHEGGLPRDESRKVHGRFQKFFDSIGGVIFTNYSQIQYLKEHGYRVPERSVVLPNGVDTHSFSLAKAPAADADTLYLTYTGQFTSWKNLPLLFDSLSRLPANFRLRIAGGKSKGEDSRSYVARLEKEFGVAGRVDYLGFLHPSEVVASAISGSAVLVVPLGENMIAKFATSPMKLVEYMATPIPIVAVAHPSVTHLTGDDTVHLSSQDPGEFAAAIRAAVSENPEQRRQRIERTNRVSQQYDHLERARKYDLWLQSF